MRELEPILLIVSFAYAAAGVGIVSALLVRTWNYRRARRPTAGEAAWCAFLPPLALLLLPLSTVEPHPTGIPGAVHALWHGWQRTLHATPFTHAALHAANYLLLGLAAMGVVRMVFRIAQMRAFASCIHKAASPSATPVEGAPLFSIASARPLCFTMGVLRPAVYLSTGLREQLSPREREAMLAHEATHVRRRDGVVRTFLSLFYTLFPLPGSRLLLADWHHAAERECDAAAAGRIGSATDVAAALIRAAQAMARSSACLPGGACFAAFGDDIEGRVEALLALPSSGSRGWPTRLVLAGLGSLWTASLWFYHAVELFVRH
jgi:beta-lactamase regulating signal transducer with metallopeptidase domain